MKINNKLLKQVLCLFFICILFISNCVITTFADDEDDKFYTDDSQALDDLFSMTVKDIYGDLKDPMGFIADGRTFVVIREYEDEEEGTKYKIYVNVPNLPQYLQNLALKTISDGWEDNTFEPESSLIADVGSDNNVMTKFGFHISVNKYQGEYPRLFMSLSGILPVKWYQKLWRGLKALVGLSFVDAPDKDNFKTLHYYNHQYSEVDNDLIDFIQDYWLDYFVNAILSDESNYFRDAADFRAQLITKDEIEEAEDFEKDHSEELEIARAEVDEYNKWYDKYYNYKGVYNNVSSFKAEVDALQTKVDNETDATKKAKYEQQLTKKKSEWESHVDEISPKAPEVSEASQDILMREAEANYIKERYKDFEARWKYGKNKNSNSYTDDDYAFSYAQCLLDITEEDKDNNGGENDCSKIVDGQQISGSVVDVFVGSGLYKIGLDDKSKKHIAENERKMGTFSPQSELKILKEITSSSGSTSIDIPNEVNASTAQSFAYVDGGYAITYNNAGGAPPSYVVAYDSGGHKKGSINYDEVQHGNGACSTQNGTYLVSGLLDGNGQTAYEFSIDENSVKSKGEKHLPVNTSAIAYDKDTGNYILSSGHTMYVYDSSLKRKIISISRNQHGAYFQDIGAGGGYVFACHTCSTDKHGNNYIDIYNEITGQYCGSIFIDYGELESVDVINGEVVALVHGKDTSKNYIHPTGVRCGRAGGGISEPLEYEEELSRADAIKILTLLQSKCGPTYQEVMENIVTCMIQNAAHEGEEIELEEYIDPRVMPYDRNTLIISGGGGVEVNGANVHIDDPRVNIYKKENLIGSFVVTGRLHLSYLLKSNLIIKGSLWLTSVCARLSIFFNQITNFKVIDDLGLSPTNMWKSFSYKVVIAIIMILLIISIVRIAVKFFKGNAGIREVLGKVGFFLGIMVLILLLVLYPDKTWNNYKTLFNKVNNMGEMTIVNTMDNVGELYGDKTDSSVTYYLTYFNLWTLYHTGYSIAAPQQVIDYSDPEMEDIDMEGIPEINKNPTSLWCVMLADSFNRQGKNVTNMSTNGKNGLNINANAYRVVDHFIAPRLYTTGPGTEEGSLNMINTVNENYNGKFQNIDFFTCAGSVVNGVTLLLLAFVKAMTFLWMWYMLYIFVFNIVISAVHERNGLRNVVIRTLSPILAMAVIGAWAGLVIQISMISEGFINLLLNFTLLWLTLRFICGWENNFRLAFPGTLNWLVRLIDRNKRDLYRRQKALDDDAYANRRRGEVDINTIIDQDGNYTGSATDKNQIRAYKRAIEQAQMQAINTNGKTHSYDNIEDERLRRKVEQLDRAQGIPAGMAGTAKFNMDAELKNHSAIPVNENNNGNNNSNTNNSTNNLNQNPQKNKPAQHHSDPTKLSFDQDNQPSKKIAPKKIGEGGKTTTKNNGKGNNTTTNNSNQGGNNNASNS